MKTVQFSRKALSMFLAVLMLVVFNPVSATASNNFSASIKQEFYQFISTRYQGDWGSYNAFTLHDLDGDAIPEVLFGCQNEQNTNFAYYDIFKYSNKEFKKIGIISESRYLMKDKYSHAILGIYANISEYAPRANIIISNYYIHNSTLQTNTVLMHTEDGFTLKNNMQIDLEQYEKELYNYLGTYDELMVHDLFTESVIYTAIFSWRPTMFPTPYPNNLKTQTALTKDWQLKYFEFLNYMRGPRNTYYDAYSDDFIYRKEYDRFALHDLDGSGIPELLVATTYGGHYSFDVYKYINKEVTFIGSFDGYSKYIGKMPDSKDIFSYDPVSNLFNFQMSRNISYKNFALDITDLLSVYINPDNRNATVYSINGKASTYTKYNEALLSYVNSCTEIKSYDAWIVPYDAVLASWRPNK